MIGKVDAYGLTHRGRVRPTNQDHFLIADVSGSLRVRQSSLDRADEPEEEAAGAGKLLVVADGMGGHASGDRASTIAVDCLAASLLDRLGPWATRGRLSDEALLEELKRAMGVCQARILEDVARCPDRYGMGTTLTMAYLAWPHCYLAHVGDSRCYQLHCGQLAQMTRDHTIAQQCVEDGLMSPKAAEHSWLSHALWNVVGGPSPLLEPEVAVFSLQAGDWLLLCTDGLTKHVTDEMIHRVLADSSRAEEACRELIALANQGGGTDNVTVVAARMVTNAQDPLASQSDSVLDEPVDKATGDEDTLPLDDGWDAAPSSDSQQGS